MQYFLIDIIFDVTGVVRSSDPEKCIHSKYAMHCERATKELIVVLVLKTVI